jgi:DNA repair protein RecN (Recombination protein N)
MLSTMLEQLKIRNLAIAETVEVQFSGGLNVITGETGAGKSLLVNALNLILGERADKTLIRAGAQDCTVEGDFALQDAAAVDAVLEDLGVAPCEDGRLIIRRVISSSGSGRNLVNDSSTTLQTLKRLGSLLVDLHGPHDHQSLLDQSFQLQILDSYAGTGTLMTAYQRVYDEMRALQRERQDLAGENDAEVAQRIDMLRFQVKEIDDAELDGIDEEELESELTRVANATRIIELANGVDTILSGDEGSVFDGVAAVQQHLSELGDILGEDAKAWQAEAQSMAVQVQELSSAVAGMAQSIEYDSDRLQWLEDRKALLYKLKRKYGGSLSAIMETVSAAREKLAKLESREARLDVIDEEIRKVRDRLEQEGAALRASRAKAARKLAKQVTGHLRDLGFAHGAFDVGLESAEPTRSGLDLAEYGFAPNAGEPMRALRAIASSGEISRVMLAIKAVLAGHDRVPVLVFDEIDANVGGEMGCAIGEKMAHVSKSHQVLCITHLPQVAVHGGAHFVVEKQVVNERTTTGIQHVTSDARIDEIARMLGGRESTSVTLDHAREMLQTAAL